MFASSLYEQAGLPSAQHSRYTPWDALNVKAKVDPHELLNDILRQAIANFEPEHSHLPRAELSRLWRQQWLCINSSFNGSSLPASLKSLRRHRIQPMPAKKHNATTHVQMYCDETSLPTISRSAREPVARTAPNRGPGLRTVPQLINSPKTWEPSILGISIIHPYLHLPADMIIWAMREYCASYLESPRAASHEEPQIHRFTTHAAFAHRLQNGILSYLSGDTMKAFSSFESAFNLIIAIFRNHHPMSIAMVFTVICELKKNNLQDILAQLVSYIRQVVLTQHGPSHVLTVLFSILESASYDAASLAVCSLRMAVDFMGRTCGDLFWKNLYLKERLCDCLYYEGIRGEGAALRANLLEEQEMVYGKCARNVLVTLANIADDELQQGKPWSAETRFRDVLERSQALDGYERGNARFKALQGLSKTAIAAADSIPQYADHFDHGFASEDRKGLRKRMLSEALRLLLEAEEEAQTWFEPDSPRRKSLSERILLCENMLRIADVVAEPVAAPRPIHCSSKSLHNDDRCILLAKTSLLEISQSAAERSEGAIRTIKAYDRCCEMEEAEQNLHKEGNLMCEESLEVTRSVGTEIPYCQITNNYKAAQLAIGTILQSQPNEGRSDSHRMPPPVRIQEPILPGKTPSSWTASLHPGLLQTDDANTALEGSCAELDDEQSFIRGTSGEDSLSTEREKQLSSLSDRVVYSMLKGFLRYAGYERPAASGSSSANSRSRTQEQSSSSAATGLTSMQSFNKRSYSSEDGPGDSDNAENGDNGKKACQSPSNESPGALLFACPYYRNNGNRYSPCNTRETNYRGCSSAVLRTIPRLKLHLYRVHRRPDFYCGRCNRIFKTEDTLEDHTRLDPPCETKNPLFREKMSKTQVSAIKKKNVRAIAHAEWFKIYKILFPQAPKPPDAHAYADLKSVPPVQKYLAYFQAAAPTQLLQILREVLPGSVFTPQENADMWDETLERAISRLFQALRPTTDNSGLNENVLQSFNDAGAWAEQIPEPEYTIDMDALVYDLEGFAGTDE